MQCPECGREVDDEELVCPDCGHVFGRAESAPLPLNTAHESRHGTGRIPHRGRSGSDTVLTLVATISIAAVVVIGFWTLILPSLANRKPAGPSPSIRQESSSSTSTSDATSNDTTTADTTSGSDETGSSEPVAKAVYILPDSDSRYYSASELAGLTDEQLVLARNEIYARHGRGFSDATIRSYFESQSWYKQIYTAEEFDAMPSPLNQYESANVSAILHAEAVR